jgi:7-keto-8-aminopelargonate synthetase-like enzyme
MPTMQLPPPLQSVDRTRILWQGRKLTFFGGCDYFRLATHPAVLRAVRHGLQRFGLNASASRMTTGNHPIYEKLELNLAQFFGVESALLASNGWSPNLMVAQALAARFSHALIDERAHGCLVDAAQLLDCPVIRFKHRNAADLAKVLRRLGQTHPILLTDGLFAHSGEVAPLKEYLAALPPGAMMLVDDAHGAGVLGKRGRGTPEYLRVTSRQIIQTISLSKAFGVFGGAVLGNRALRTAILERSRVFVGSTPLPPPLANAALVSLDVLRKGTKLRALLRENARHVRDQLRSGGIPVADPPGPIVSLDPMPARSASRLEQRLVKAGIHPPLIRYPGGPEEGYFRFVISSEHCREELNRLAETIVSGLKTAK